jgi:hypothetical protein
MVFGFGLGGIDENLEGDTLIFSLLQRLLAPTFGVSR